MGGLVKTLRRIRSASLEISSETGHVSLCLSYAADQEYGKKDNQSPVKRRGRVLHYLGLRRSPNLRNEGSQQEATVSINFEIADGRKTERQFLESKGSPRVRAVKSTARIHRIEKEESWREDRKDDIKEEPT